MRLNTIVMIIVAVLSANLAFAKPVQAKFQSSVRNVKLVVDGTVVIHTGSDRSEVKVTCSDKDKDILRIAYGSDSLEIGPNALVTDGSKPKVEKVEIWMDALRQVSVYGVSDVYLGTVDGTALSVNYYGVGTLRADLLDVTSFDLQLFGLANADIKRIDGTSMRMALAGRGDIKIGSQDITTLDMVLSGIGNVDLGEIDATNVNINVAGTGKVKVRGDATTARLYCGANGSIDSYGLETVRTIYTDFDKTFNLDADSAGYDIQNYDSLQGLKSLESLKELEKLGTLGDALRDSLENSLNGLGEMFDNIDWTGGKVVVEPQKNPVPKRKNGGKLISP